MSAGWLIAEDTKHMTAAVFVVSNINSLSSYRAELEGTFRLLKHIEYLGMTPEEVIHWCDNEAAVLATNKTEPDCPSELIGADADIILAIMQHHKKNWDQIEMPTRPFSPRREEVENKRRKAGRKETKSSRTPPHKGGRRGRWNSCSISPTITTL
jgi:hypothetical protein